MSMTKTLPVLQVLPSLKELPQLQFKAGLPFFRGLVLDRLSLLLSRPFLPPPTLFPLKEPMADRERLPPRNSSRYRSVSLGEDEEKVDNEQLMS